MTITFQLNRDVFKDDLTATLQACMLVRTVPAQQNYLLKPRFGQFHLGLNSVATEFIIRLVMA